MVAFVFFGTWWTSNQSNNLIKRCMFNKIIEESTRILAEAGGSEIMKKVGIILLLLMLAGCSSADKGAMPFTEEQAVPFEIVQYEEKIAPIYETLVPYISYAKNEAQLTELQKRFKMDKFTMDFGNYMAVFLVTYSDSCGIAVDGVYNDAGKLAVQLMEPKGDNCKKEGIPHTFVLQVAKQDYEKVQLYNGNTIKSSTEVKE